MDRFACIRRSGGALFPLIGLVAILAILAPLDGAAAAGTSTVWLRIDSETEGQTVRFAGPLEWLATAGWAPDSDRRIVIEGIRLDLQALWAAHRDLPVGQTREIVRGATDHGDPYVARVTCDAVPKRLAEGKMRLMVRDDDDEVTDLRFPLKVASFVTTLLGSFPLFGEIGAEEQKRIRDFPPFKALDDLGAYGPFVLFELADEGPRAKIAIE